MSSFDAIKKKTLRRPTVKAAYDKLEPELALAMA